MLQRPRKKRSYQEVLHIAVANVSGVQKFVAVAVDLPGTCEQSNVGVMDSGLKSAAAG